MESAYIAIRGAESRMTLQCLALLSHAATTKVVLLGKPSVSVNILNVE